MPAGDWISVRSRVWSTYIGYIPTGIESEFMSFGVNFVQKENIIGIFGGELMKVHCSGQTIHSCPHIGGI